LADRSRRAPWSPPNNIRYWRKADIEKLAISHRVNNRKTSAFSAKIGAADSVFLSKCTVGRGKCSLTQQLVAVVGAMLSGVSDFCALAELCAARR
jgi:hypothetical protein